MSNRSRGGERTPDGALAKRYRLFFDAGHDNAHVARKMGVSIKTVEAWRRILGGSPRLNRVERYRAHFEAGHSNASIAEDMGVIPATVVRRRRVMGYLPESPGAASPQYGIDLEVVASGYNVPDTTIRQVRDRFYPNAPLTAVAGAVARARRKGLITRPKPHVETWTQEEYDRAEYLLREEGMSYKMVAEQLGKHEGSAAWLAVKFPGLGWSASQRMEYYWMQKRLESL